MAQPTVSGHAVFPAIFSSRGLLGLRKIFLAVGVISVVGLWSGAAAPAERWLDPCESGHTALGPDKATGAVIWSHGRSVDSEDFQAPTPPYMTTLGDGGWDTFRFNRLRASDTLPDSARALADQVHELKRQGYRQVVLAGQSFGAFLALMAADASDEVDAVVATAPAAFGTFADFYDTWRANATELYSVLERVKRARVMLFYFHGDEFDPGGRGERSRDILSARNLPYVVVDQPALLTTHWAAATPQFADAFGGCILGFVDAAALADGARCDGDRLWAGTPAVKMAQPLTASHPGDKSGGG
jgi:dienelactone hydrolase